MARWPRTPTAEQAALVEEARQWERTPRRKVICPVCGAAGYLGGSWIWKHVAHDPTPCGRQVAHGYLGVHLAHCHACQLMSPTMSDTPDEVETPETEGDESAEVEAGDDDANHGD